MYPTGDPERGFASLQPDRLGERLIGRLMLDRTRVSIVETVAGQVSEFEAERYLMVCTRAAAHRELADRLPPVLTQWCVRYANTLAPTAFQVATRSKIAGPLARAIGQVVADPALDTSLLERLLAAVPHRSQMYDDSTPLSQFRSHIRATVPLRSLYPQPQGHYMAEFFVMLSQMLVSRILGTSIDDPNRDAKLGFALTTLSGWLLDANHPEDGIKMITGAVQFYRQAAFRSDAFLPALAQALHDLAVQLFWLDREKPGLVAIAESIDIRRRLVLDRPDVHQPKLEQALTVLAWLDGSGADEPSPW